MTAVAMLLALLGAACYAVGAALQHQQAARTTTSSRDLHPRLLVRLARQPRWLAGILANLAGLGLHVLALAFAPLALVQPIGVMTVVFAVPAGALLRRRRPHLTELVGAGLVSAGLALLMTTLRAPHHIPSLQLLDVVPLAGIVVGALTVASLVVRRVTGPARTIVLAASTGVAFGVTSALVRPLIHAFNTSGITMQLGWIALASASVAAIGMLMQQSSFQTGRLGLAMGVITVVEPIAAITIGGAFLGQPAIVTNGLAVAAATPLVVAGVALLCRRFRRRYDGLPTRWALGGRPASGLRILIGTDTYPPHVNGTASFAHRLAHGLAARGHDVHVCCPASAENGQPGIEDDGPVRVHRVRSMRTPFHRSFRVAGPLSVYGDARRVLEEVRPDVVHVQNHFMVGRALCRLADHRNLPLVATNHFMPENLLPYLRLPGPLARLATTVAWRDLARIFRPAAALTAPTPTAAGLVAASGIGKDVEAVSNGIDMRRFTAQPDGTDGTVPTGPTGRRRILFVGQLNVEKHIDDIITALPAVREHVDAEVVVAGTGNELADLRRHAADRGVAEHVRFLGYVPDDDLPGLYASADVFCMPSTAELQSLATLEAMATGRPVVAADAVALPHLCQHGRNGFLHPPRDHTELAQHLTTVLTDDALRARMGRESHRIALTHEESASMHRFEEIYSRVTGYPLPVPSDETEPIAA